MDTHLNLSWSCLRQQKGWTKGFARWMTNTTIVTDITWCSNWANLTICIYHVWDIHRYWYRNTKWGWHATWPQNLLYLITFRSPSNRTCKSLHVILAEELTNQESSETGLLILIACELVPICKCANEQHQWPRDDWRSSRQSSAARNPRANQITSQVAAAQGHIKGWWHRAAVSPINVLLRSLIFWCQKLISASSSRWLVQIIPRITSLHNRGSCWNVWMPDQAMVIPESGHQRPL